MVLLDGLGRQPAFVGVGAGAAGATAAGAGVGCAAGTAWVLTGVCPLSADVRRSLRFVAMFLVPSGELVEVSVVDRCELAPVRATLVEPEPFLSRIRD